MLRGMIRQKTRQPILPVLVLAMAVGMALVKHNVEAAPVGEVEWKTEMLSQTFVAQDVLMHSHFTPFEDGSIKFDSHFGEFDGTWSMTGDTVCVYFDNGPLKGERCNQLVALGEGRYQLSDGVVIERVAKGKTF